MSQFANPYLESLRAEVPLDHLEKMTTILREAFSDSLKFEDKIDFLAWAKEALPLIKWSECDTFPGSLVVYLLCLKNSQLQIESFFPDMLRRWLIPGKEASILAFNHMYFYPKDLPEQSFFIGELKILIETPQEGHHAISHLSSLAQEMTLALDSPFYASYILMKNVPSHHVKITRVHQKLNQLMRKFRHQVDESILDEMGRFLTLSSKEFLNQRHPRHIMRLITSIYLFYKSISRAVTYSPGLYHSELRFLPTVLEFPFGCKPVLGCLIGINMVEDYEILEERHILFAVRKIIPQAEIVKGSCYFYEHKEEKIKILYVELEKRDGSYFSLVERRKLKHNLKEQLKNCIEKLMPPIFMIRNEEEILRNILMLRREICSTKDLPQAIISLDRQTKTEIIFTVIWVSVCLQGRNSLQKAIEQNRKNYSLYLERQQVVGYLRKKYPIEAYVFRLRFPKDFSLLRSDLSLNFYLAREKVASFLTTTLGEFRDYNGGIILKQTETLSRLKQEFGNAAESNTELIEDFFYSISPIEQQATLSFSSLETLFKLLLQGLSTELKGPYEYILKTHEKDSLSFVVVLCRDSSLKAQLSSAMNSLDFTNQYLITSDLSLKEAEAFCYIFKSPDAMSRRDFYKTIEQTIETWRNKVESTKVFKINISYHPTSLDPRLAGDEFTSGILRLLFEGLTRMNREGHLEYGIAESAAISPDQKRYTFKLRKTQWNNGTPILAYDFEYAWKTILSPHFKTSFDYLFYPIKNAKEAKQGFVSLDQVGVKALDDRTLLVELVFPTPYFLELTAHTIYSPVHHRIDMLYPNWPLQTQEGYVCNGAFQLKTNRSNHYYEFIKNPSYWDAENIEIDKMIFFKDAYHSTNQMFRKGEIDLIGQPFGLLDPTFKQAENDKLTLCLNTGVYWYIFNTQRFPFQNLKLRRAFALAINRPSITESLSIPVRPSYALLQPFLSQYTGQNLLKENRQLAHQLFEEALAELNLTKDTFPLVTILYSQGDIRDKTAYLMKQQWEEAFKIRCRLEPLEWHFAFDKMKRGDFSICGIVWKSLVNDPTYVLNSFRFSNEHTNLSRWENPDYQQLLDLADRELNTELRKHYLTQAEEILAKEVPAVPLFYTDFRAAIKKHIELPHISHLGILDLKWTKIRSLQSN